MFKFSLILIFSFIYLSLANKPDVIVQFDIENFKDADSFIKQSVAKTWESNAPRICEELGVDCTKIEDAEEDYTLLAVLYKNINLEFQYVNTETNIPNGVIIKCTYNEEQNNKTEKQRLTYMKMLRIAIGMKLREALECSLTNGQSKPPIIVSFVSFQNNITKFVKEIQEKAWNECAPFVAEALGSEFYKIETDGKVNLNLANQLYHDINVKLIYNNSYSDIPSSAEIIFNFKTSENLNEEQRLNYMKTLQYVLFKIINESISRNFVIGKCREPSTIIFPKLKGDLGSEEISRLSDIAWNINKNDLAAELGVDPNYIDDQEIDNILASQIYDSVLIKYIYEKTEWYNPKALEITYCKNVKLTTDKEKLVYLKTIQYISNRKIVTYLTRSLKFGRTEQDPYDSFLPIKTKEEINQDFKGYIQESKKLMGEALKQRIKEEYNIDITILDYPVDFVEVNKIARDVMVKFYYCEDEKFVPYRFEIISKYEHNPFMMTLEKRSKLISAAIFAVERLFTAKLAKSIQDGKDGVTIRAKFPQNRYGSTHEYIKDLQRIIWYSNIKFIAKFYNIDATEISDSVPNQEFAKEIENNLAIELSFEFLENHYPSGVSITCSSKLDVLSFAKEKREEFVISLKHIIYHRIANLVADTINIGRIKPPTNVMLPNWTIKQLKEKVNEVRKIIWESNAEWVTVAQEITIRDIEIAEPIDLATRKDIEGKMTPIYCDAITCPYQIRLIWETRYSSHLSKSRRASIARAYLEIVNDKVGKLILNLP